MKSEWSSCKSLFFILLSTKISKADDCSPTNVATKLANCNLLAVGITSYTTIYTFKSKLFSYCDTLECNIACRESIEKPCNDQGMVYDDLNAKRVAHRYMCANKEDVVHAMRNCGSSYDSWNCMSNLNWAVQSAVSSLRQNPNDYHGYLLKYCSAIKDFRACESSTTWYHYSPCTAYLADILNNITDVSFSMEVCGIPQTNPLFYSNYTRPVDSNIVQTCGSARLKGFYFLLILILKTLLTLFVHKEIY